MYSPSPRGSACRTIFTSVVLRYGVSTSLSNSGGMATPMTANLHSRLRRTGPNSIRTLLSAVVVGVGGAGVLLDPWERLRGELVRGFAIEVGGDRIGAEKTR